MADTTEWADRRGTAAHSKRFRVSWRVKAGHRIQGTVRGRVVSVSASGLLLRMPAEYDLGSIIEIEMSPRAHVAIRALIRILRLDTSPAGEFDYGTVILYMNDEHNATFGNIVLGLQRAEVAEERERAA